MRGLRVRLRLCGRWAVTGTEAPDGRTPQDDEGRSADASNPPAGFALPAASLLAEQSTWLAPARSRLLRRAAIAHRGPVLDLGAGYGRVTAELLRRSRGPVIAFDSQFAALAACPAAAFRVAGDGFLLPFPNQTFDLVFCQCALLWMSPLKGAAAEIWRVLRPSGVLVALEPDYGAFIEHPAGSAIGDIWQAALRRAGANPLVGRQLPGVLERQGFDLRVGLLDEVHPPSAIRLDFLRDLRLTDQERRRIDRLPPRSLGWQHIAHLPFFLILATRKPARQ